MSSRGKNFTEREKCQLMEIISKYKHIIENKCTNSGSVVQKQEAWESITAEFNSNAETRRTQKQLHTAYLNLKRTTRQNVANENIFSSNIMKRRVDHIFDMLNAQEEEITERNLSDSCSSFIENTPERDLNIRIQHDSLPQNTQTTDMQIDTCQIEEEANMERTESRSPTSSTIAEATTISRSSSSSSSTSSSSSSNQSSPTKSTSRSAIRPNYQVSPINSNESDADLSDSDPTYANNRRKGVANISRSSSSSPSPSPPRNSSRSDDTPRLSRKRKRDPDNWKQNRLKMLRNSGKPYVSLSKLKKQVPARCIKAACTCRLKCPDNIQHADRINLFDYYWQLNDIDLQRSYIRSCMLEVTPKYKYSNAARPRKPNNAFFFVINGTKIRVCKNFFINTLDVSDRVLRTIKAKTNSHGFVEKDMRGRHANRKETDPKLIDDIKNHINSIPKIESHYLRAQTSREFISNSKTITDIWKDFNALQRERNKSECEYWLYSKIFNTEFNIGFFKPMKDRCDTCVAFDLAPPDQKLELKANYDQHLLEKQLCRDEKKRDRDNVDETHICAIFDLQSVMLCPSPAYFYYCSKINCLDFTITELNRKQDKEASYGQVNCYFWDETQGLRGPNEIGSCIYDYLKELSQKHPDKMLHVTFYSDNCAGQNKNKVIASLYSFAVASLHNIESITHKYLIKGHTQNEADNVHSLIEKEIIKNEKSGPIYISCQYATIIKSARKTGPPFKVKELDFRFFFNIKSLQEKWGYNYNENTNKETIIWNNIKVLKFVKGQDTFEFNYKTSYMDTEYKTINMRNKRRKMLSFNEIELEQLYSQGLGLKENKKKDLLELVKKKYDSKLLQNFL